MNEDKVLQAIAQLSDNMVQMEVRLNARMDRLESRLDCLESEVKSLRKDLKETILGTTLTIDDLANIVSETMEAREEPIYRALEENRAAINMLAKPLTMPPIRKASNN